MATDAEMQNTFVLTNESIVVAVLKLYPIRTQLSYVPMQEQCGADLINDTYFAWFSWLPLATYNGNSVILSMITDMWTLSTPDGHYLALYNIGNTPIRLVTSNYMHQSTSIIDFFDFKPVQPPAQLFDLPVYCIEHREKAGSVPLSPGKAGHHEIKKLNVVHRVVAQTDLAHKDALSEHQHR